MATQNDAFNAALADFATRIGTLQTDIQAQVDAAVAAQQAKDDAAFKDATDKLTALAASLPQHVEAVQQAASPTEATSVN